MILTNRSQLSCSVIGASALIRGTTIEKGKARLRSSRLQRALRTESEPPQISKIEWLNVTTINLDKALTPSKASLELAHLPRTWPEAKLIAPVLLPAPSFTDEQPVGGVEAGIKVQECFGAAVN